MACECGGEHEPGRGKCGVECRCLGDLPGTPGCPARIFERRDGEKLQTKKNHAGHEGIGDLSGLSVSTSDFLDTADGPKPLPVGFIVIDDDRFEPFDGLA